MRGATFATRSSLILFIISIHAPHARSDLRTLSASTCIPYFNPRSSCEERQLGVKFVKRVIPISIHAPHARSDCGEVMRGWMLMSISIHAPHARSDSAGLAVSALRPHFNPRSSCEERPPILSLHIATSYFNPRSSCEERLCRSCSVSASTAFQSTLLMRGATTRSLVMLRSSSAFQSTLLMRGATADIIPAYRDIVFQSTLLMRGATCSKSTCAAQRWIFQSTLLMRGATVTSVPVDCTLDDISIHAPHARSDSSISW